jgi:hypothetical protein
MPESPTVPLIPPRPSSRATRTQMTTKPIAENRPHPAPPFAPSRLRVNQAVPPPAARSPQPAGSPIKPYPPTAFIISKIGKYIATIIPPTTTPRNTIMIGSSALSSASTAASTSSS